MDSLLGEEDKAGDEDVFKQLSHVFDKNITAEDSIEIEDNPPEKII